MIVLYHASLLMSSQVSDRKYKYNMLCQLMLFMFSHVVPNTYEEYGSSGIMLTFSDKYRQITITEEKIISYF